MAQRTIASLLDSIDVAVLAGPASYARGVLYRGEGRVELGDAGAHRVNAIVRGTRPYEVTLVADGNQIAWACSCPVGADGDFCKHCVAVALAVGASTAKPKRKPASPAAPEIDLRDFVASMDATELAGIVLEQVDADWRLRERLMARAATSAGASVDEREWRARIKDAFGGGRRFIDYREAPEWAAGVHDVLAGLAELIDAGQASTVIGLAEYAHTLADKAVQRIDDSDGWLSDISSQIADLHLLACEKGAPDAVALGRRLAELERGGELDTWHRAALKYADVLGPTGLAEYRQMIEPAWRALGPETDRWSSERFRLQNAMVAIALAQGDADELIRVKQHDLRTPDDYGEVADLLRATGRIGDAIDWARRGLDTYADRPWQTPPLRELLARMLRESGRRDDAVAEFWSAYERTPSVDAYRRVLSEADESERAELQQRAIETLRRRIEDVPPDDVRRRSVVIAAPATALVEILLFEGDVDGAWDAATAHGVADSVWLTLARARQKDHPLEVIPIYEQAAATEIDRKNNGGYRKGVEHLARIRTLAIAAGAADRFDRLLIDVRTKHKAKRNLMALLDKRGW